jgi:chromosome partitioning protein
MVTSRDQSRSSSLSEPKQIGARPWSVFSIRMAASFGIRCGCRRRGYQDVVIDAGGHDSTTLRAALLLSDAVLVPFLPRTVDVLALADMATLIEEARGVRDGLLAMAVLNVADPGVSPDNADAIAALADLPQLVGLKATITRRKAFPNAAGFGLSVDELAPPDPKACAELAALVREVSAMVKQLISNGR